MNTYKVEVIRYCQIFETWTIVSSGKLDQAEIGPYALREIAKLEGPTHEGMAKMRGSKVGEYDDSKGIEVISARTMNMAAEKAAVDEERAALVEAQRLAREFSRKDKESK